MSTEPREDVRKPKFDSFQSEKDGLWYWHIVGANGEIMGDSSEGYHTREHADEGIASVKRVVAEIFVADPDSTPAAQDDDPDEDPRWIDGLPSDAVRDAES